MASAQRPQPARRWAIGLWLAVLCAAPGGADDHIIAGLERDLALLGYENLAFRAGDSTFAVWCENRRVRYPVVWMVEALALAAQRLPTRTRLTLVAEKLARPVVAITAMAGDVSSWMAGRLPTAEFRRRLELELAGDERPEQTGNSSIRRVDLMLGPGRLLSEFGVPGDWIRVQLDLALELQTTLSPGLLAQGRVYVPLHAKGQPIGGDLRNREMRVGTVLGSYLLPLGRRSFCRATAGIFELGSRSRDSYGTVVDFVHYSHDGSWAIGCHVGYLGFAAYQVDENWATETMDRPGHFRRDRVWLIVWPPRNVPYQGYVSYRFAEFDLRLTARWGRFLLGDNGWRVDVARHMGEIGVTIFGIRSDARFRAIDQVGARNDVRLLGGLRIDVPLFPRRRAMPSPFRVMSAESFSWSYRYRAGDVGVDISTKYGVEDMIGQYSPAAVASGLERARSWVRSEEFRRERGRHGVVFSVVTAD